ncbi:MAG: hypothetical protein ACK5GF_03315 [Rhodoluna sp.]|jgi:hypothetical protein
MLQDIEGWGSLAAIIGLLLSTVALALVFVQIRQFTRAERSTSRAYVSARVVTGETRGNPSLFLVLKNHGRSPAKDVFINFDHENNWHYVARPDRFPFAQGNKILQILPDEEIKFFLGQMLGESRLLQLRTGQATGTLVYSDQFASNRKEPVILTLLDRVFVAS